MAVSRQYRSAEDVCKSKHRYGSKEIADRVAAAATKKAGKPIRSYKCLVCPWFHLTSRAAP